MEISHPTCCWTVSIDSHTSSGLSPPLAALIRAVFGWGGQRHKATNRQAEQASPPNPTIKSPNIKFNLSLARRYLTTWYNERQATVKSMRCRFDGSLFLVPRSEYLTRGRLRSFTAILPDAIGASPEVQLLKSEVQL
jgi:hypothetical protein